MTLPRMDIRFCVTPDAAREQALVRTRAGQEPYAAAGDSDARGCVRQVIQITLASIETSIGPYEAWVPVMSTEGKASTMLWSPESDQGEVVRYEMTRGMVTVWRATIAEGDAKGEEIFAELPDRPLELAFLEKHRLWPPKGRKAPALQVCPGGVSDWLADRRTSCRV